MHVSNKREFLFSSETRSREFEPSRGIDVSIAQSKIQRETSNVNYYKRYACLTLHVSYDLYQVDSRTFRSVQASSSFVHAIISARDTRQFFRVSPHFLRSPILATRDSRFRALAFVSAPASHPAPSSSRHIYAVGETELRIEAGGISVKLNLVAKLDSGAPGDQSPWPLYLQRSSRLEDFDLCG